MNQDLMIQGGMIVAIEYIIMRKLKKAKLLGPGIAVGQTITRSA